MHIYIYNVLNLAIKEYPQMIMYVQKIYGTSAVLCLAYVSFHLGSTRARHGWAETGLLSLDSRAMFPSPFCAWKCMNHQGKQMCANNIPRQQLLQLWPWLPVITGYFYGIIHSINGVFLVLINDKWP